RDRPGGGDHRRRDGDPGAARPRGRVADGPLELVAAGAGRARAPRETGRIGSRPMLPELPSLPGVAHRHVAVRGVRIHVAEAGEGEPLVLQHGWPQAWWRWRKMIPPLAERYRVIVPDLRGHGWSEEPRTGYEKESLAQDL